MLRLHLKTIKKIVTIEQYELSYPFNIYAVSKPEKKIYWSLDTLEYTGTKSGKSFRISYSKKINISMLTDGLTGIRNDGTEITGFNTALKDPRWVGEQMLLFEKRPLFFLKLTNYNNTLLNDKELLPAIMLKKDLSEAREHIQFHITYVDQTGDTYDDLHGSEHIIINLKLFEEEKE